MPGKRVATSERRPGRKGLLIALVAAGLLTLVIGWSVRTILSNGGAPSSNGQAGPVSTDGGEPTPSQQSTHGTPGEGGSSGRLLRACAAEVSKADRAFSAARAGVSHWGDHVQARTDMLAGRISVEKMDAVWKRTRTAGPADQQRFQAALQQYDGMVRCDDLQNVPQSQKDAFTDCITRSKTADDAVTAAQAAMGDWKSHLDHMAAFAAGGMNASQAQRMWVRAWRNAPENISMYGDASAALANDPSCVGTVQ